jgi:hypothetical protein
MHGTLINAAVLKYSQMDTLLRTLHTPAQRRRRNPPNRAGWHDERCGNLRQRRRSMPLMRGKSKPRASRRSRQCGSVRRPCLLATDSVSAEQESALSR